MTLGDRIKTLREKHSMTQSELAIAIRSTKQTVYKYENNIITNIPSDKIEIIADRLHTTPAHLMGWDELDINKDLIKQEYLDIAKELQERNVSADELLKVLKIYDMMNEEK